MTTALATTTAPAPSTGSIVLAERILDAFPSASYSLSALLRLLDIVESTDVPTAAVECRIQPRLLINPEFAAQHAATAEKLLMLVMHELHHILLGHTTLFKRVTKIDNFVFDAVINGLVCRMFPDEAHTNFFSDFYRADAFPECLLRPPPGWPNAPVMAEGIAALPEPQRGLTDEVHRALYSDAGASYKEVFDSLPKSLVSMSMEGVPLLGSHGDEDEGELLSPLLFDIVRDIVEQWPQPPDPIRGRSLSDVLKQQNLSTRRPPASRHTLRRLIRKVAGTGAAGTIRRVRTDLVDTSTPIPGFARRSLVQRALGFEPLLHSGQLQWRRSTRTGERVHVYLDVSGSMDGVKSALYGAVLDCQELVHPTVHLFSTRVADIGLNELRRGLCHSTGGTDIGCVAEHMATNRVRRALLVTDGWVGTPTGQHHTTLAATKLAVAFFGPSTNSQDLASVADHTATLSIGDMS